MNNLLDLLFILILFVSQANPAQSQAAEIAVQDQPTTRSTTVTLGDFSEDVSATPVGLVSSRAFENQYEDLIIVGEIINNTASPLQSVKVIATLYDDQQNIISTELTYTRMDFIDTGSKAPFAIRASESAGFETYTIITETSEREPYEQVVEILSSRAVIDQYDNLYIVGEIQNPYDQSIESAEVIATLYDDSGTVINTDSGYVNVNTIMPGAKAPFAIYISDFEGFTTYALNAEALAGQAVEQTVTIIDSRAFVDEYDSLQIVGEIQNDNDVSIQSISVVAALYDSNDEIVFVENGYVLANVVEPGEMAPFTIRIYEFENFESYALFTNSYEADEADPIVTVTTSRAVETEYGDLYIIGIAENNGEVPLEYPTIIATLYDAAGDVINVGSASTELDVLNVGDYSPFSIFVDEYEGWDNYTLMTEGRPAEDVFRGKFSVIDSRSYSDDFGTQRIVGEVENMGETSAEAVRIIASIYDEAGNLIAVETTYAELDTIEAGGKSPFELTSYGLEAEIGSYDLLVESR